MLDGPSRHLNMTRKSDVSGALKTECRWGIIPGKEKK